MYGRAGTARCPDAVPALNCHQLNHQFSLGALYELSSADPLTASCKGFFSATWTPVAAFLLGKVKRVARTCACAICCLAVQESILSKRCLRFDFKYQTRVICLLIKEEGYTVNTVQTRYCRFLDKIEI